MMEHLTPSRQRELLQVVHSLLKPGGKIYLQCIAKPKNWIGGDAYRVVEKEVFPGHYLEYPDKIESMIVGHGFRLLSEPLDHGRHYGLTTGQWLDRIEHNMVDVERVMGARNTRLFAGYLAMASVMFADGRGCLMRYAFQKPN